MNRLLILLLIILSFTSILYCNLNSNYYTKNHLENDLLVFNLRLNDDFLIKDYEKKKYGKERFEKVLVEISEKDKNTFIRKIKASYKFSELGKFDKFSEIEVDFKNGKISNYKNGDNFVKCFNKLDNEYYVIINENDKIIEIAKFLK